MCTKFGVDSSSRFPFRVRTNRQTDRHTQLNALLTYLLTYTPAAIQPAWVTTMAEKAYAHRCWQPITSKQINNYKC